MKSFTAEKATIFALGPFGWIKHEVKNLKVESFSTKLARDGARATCVERGKRTSVLLGWTSGKRIVLLGWDLPLTIPSLPKWVSSVDNDRGFSAMIDAFNNTRLPDNVLLDLRDHDYQVQP
jgi:hypothetical protein